MGSYTKQVFRRELHIASLILGSASMPVIRPNTNNSGGNTLAVTNAFAVAFSIGHEEWCLRLVEIEAQSHDVAWCLRRGKRATPRLQTRSSPKDLDFIGSSSPRLRLPCMPTMPRFLSCAVQKPQILHRKISCFGGLALSPHKPPIPLVSW